MDTQEKYTEFERIYEDIIVTKFIFAEGKGYTVKDGAHKELADKAYYYTCITKREMRNRKRTQGEVLKETILDRHKLAACLCAAIIEVRPLVKKKGESTGIDLKYANEAFAVLVSMELLQKTMVYELAESISDARIAKDFREKLYREYKMQYPDDKYGDKGDYCKNMCYDMGNTHESCEHKKGSECFHFDIFAYAKIFYHLEKWNRSIIEQKYGRYISNLPQ